MYTVWTFDEMVMDDMKVFEGTLNDCLKYIDGDDDCYIIAPDGYTMIGQNLKRFYSIKKFKKGIDKQIKRCYNIIKIKVNELKEKES